MKIETGYMMARIFIGEEDRHRDVDSLAHDKRLSYALVQRLRREGAAGATVLQGVLGFGGSSLMHSASDLSSDLPLVIEIVDTEQTIERLLPIIEEMVPDGLVTLEKIRVIRFGPR
jgi:hypothetical protein